MEPRLKNIGMIAAGAATFFLAIGITQAAFSGETVQDKIDRLEFEYKNEALNIEDADTAIEAAMAIVEKQNKIKLRAEGTLMSITISLSSLKSEREMAKEQPNMAKVAEWNGKAADFASQIDKEVSEHAAASQANMLGLDQAPVQDL